MIKITPRCPTCGKEKVSLEAATAQTCCVCGAQFEADAACEAGHYVCHMCRQKHARGAIIAHCLSSGHAQPFPLMLELMRLPDTAMHGPEHHLLLTAALLTAYCNERGRGGDLPALLDEANERSLEVPGGACGYWGVCGAAIGGGIFISIVTEADPYAGAEWKTAGQLTARCADAISCQGGPRCCKRDGFLALLQAVPYANEMLGTRFALPDDIRCDFFTNNEECKGRACPFFPKKGA